MAASSHIVPSIKDEDAIEEVVSVNEVHRLIDLGLGRGVDATNPRPWKNKSSFQVREISPTLANIIGTDEGGAHQYFEEEISSVNKKQIEAKMSVDDPTIGVSLGVAGEYSRSISKTRIAVGERVVTRTISFRANFDDLPINSVDDDILEARLQTRRVLEPLTMVPMLRTVVPASTPPEILTTTECIQEKFESKLSAWILDRIRARQEQVTEIKEQVETQDTEITVKVTEELLVQNLNGGNPIQKLAEYIQSVSRDSYQMRQIAQDCYEFIALLGLTHYVYAIKLGAVRFQTYTLAEYNSKASTKAKLGAEGFAKASIGGGSTTQKESKMVQVREIGKIDADKTVKKKPGDEAVINIQLMPIHTLVHLRAVHLAMEWALRKYITERADKSEGPFLISSGDGDNRIYWKVNKANQVVGVKDVTAASIFYATQIDDPQHPYEFFIEYYGEDDNARKKPRGTIDPLSKITTLAPLAKFLDTRASIFGYNSGPLVLTNHVHEEDARLTLHSRVVGSYNTPISVGSWTAGEEYFVNCSRRRFKVDGYLAMKQNQDYDPKSKEYPTEKFKFITAIVPSVSSHDNVTTWMLFRLLPSEYRKRPDLVSKNKSQSTKEKEHEFEKLQEKEFDYEQEKQSTKGAHKPSTVHGSSEQPLTERIKQRTAYDAEMKSTAL